MLKGKDKARADNIMRALNKGKFELSADEVFALSQAMNWLIELTNQGKVVYFLEEEPKKDIKDGKDNSTRKRMDSSAEHSSKDGPKPESGGTRPTSSSSSSRGAASGIREIPKRGRGRPRVEKSSV